MILARYLIRQFLPPFFFALALFSGVLLLDKIFDLIDLLINKGASLWLSAQMILLFFPTILSLSIPMSLLLASLLTFGRLSEESEILALRASGFSFGQILWPPVLVAAALSVALVPFNTRLTPAAMGRFRAIFHQIATTDPLVQIEPRRFVSIQNVRLYATRVSKDRKFLEDVWIYRIFPRYTQRIYAHRGTASVEASQLSLRLEDGQIERFSPGAEEDFLHVNFESYAVHIPFQAPGNARDRSWREYATSELTQEIRRRRAENLPIGEPQAEFHLRYAVAFAPLALCLIGIPLGITLERGGRGVGFGAAIGVIFVYYLLLVMGLNTAERGKWPPLPALWTANVAVTAIGFWIYKRRVAR